MPDISSLGQAGAIQEYNGRAVFVPHGMTAAEIMEAAGVLEREFEVEPYLSRHMAVAVLTAARQTYRAKEIGNP